MLSWKRVLERENLPRRRLAVERRRLLRCVCVEAPVHEELVMVRHVAWLSQPTKVLGNEDDLELAEVIERLRAPKRRGAIGRPERLEAKLSGRGDHLAAMRLPFVEHPAVITDHLEHEAVDARPQ